MLTDPVLLASALPNRLLAPLCSPPVELRFDRPFQFIIAHWPSGLAVFNGEIYTPEEWSSTA